jgi:hypothetical protein
MAAIGVDSDASDPERRRPMKLAQAFDRRHANLLGLALAATITGLVALLIFDPVAQGRRRDHTPPVFAGLASATTCIGGPIGSGISSSYHLSWEAATDDLTRARRISYEVYQASKPGGEDFSQPTYQTSRGATSFDTPKLPSDETFYFVVRARDRAGNEDSNTIEREGVNLCD